MDAIDGRDITAQHAVDALFQNGDPWRDTNPDPDFLAEVHALLLRHRQNAVDAHARYLDAPDEVRARRVEGFLRHVDRHIRDVGTRIAEMTASQRLAAALRHTLPVLLSATDAGHAGAQHAYNRATAALLHVDTDLQPSDLDMAIRQIVDSREGRQ